MLEGCGGYSHDAIAKAASITDQQSQKNAQKKSKKKSRFLSSIWSQYRRILRHCTLRGPLHGSRLISSSPQISQVLLIFLPWYLWVLSIYLSIIILLFDR